MPGNEDEVPSLCLTLRAHSRHFHKFPCIHNVGTSCRWAGGGLYGQGGYDGLGRNFLCLPAIDVCFSSL
jgi:hypothetical protein